MKVGLIVAATCFCYVFIIFIAPGFIVVKPTMTANRTGIVVTSGFFQKFASLFSMQRSVLIDTKRQLIHINSRNYWFVTNLKKLRFEDVVAVQYDYRVLSRRRRSRDAAFEVFEVSLVLKDSPGISLFHYYGTAADFSGSGLQCLDFLFERIGSHKRESKSLVDAICLNVGVPIV